MLGTGPLSSVSSTEHYPPSPCDSTYALPFLRKSKKNNNHDSWPGSISKHYEQTPWINYLLTFQLIRRAIHCSSVVNKASSSHVFDLCSRFGLDYCHEMLLPQCSLPLACHHCIYSCWEKKKNSCQSPADNKKAAMSYLTGRRVFVPLLWKLIMSGYFLTGSMSIPRSGGSSHSPCAAFLFMSFNSINGLLSHWTVLAPDFFFSLSPSLSPRVKYLLLLFEKCHN